MDDKVRKLVESEAQSAAAAYGGRVREENIRNFASGWWKPAYDHCKEFREAGQPARTLFIKLAMAKIRLRFSKR